MIILSFSLPFTLFSSDNSLFQSFEIQFQWLLNEILWLHYLPTKHYPTLSVHRRRSKLMNRSTEKKSRSWRPWRALPFSMTMKSARTIWPQIPSITSNKEEKVKRYAGKEKEAKRREAK